MSEQKLHFPEVVGKFVADLAVTENPEFGKEVLVKFSDRTQLSIPVGARLTVDARYCHEETPDRLIAHKTAN